MTPADFTSLRYETAGRKAYITLNRPERLNAIDARMPREIHAAVELANDDPEVHVIVLQGEGRSFCAGLRPQGLRRDRRRHPAERCGIRSRTTGS